jgi:hypothetical protein
LIAVVESKVPEMDAKQAQLFTSSAAFSAFAASVLLVCDQIKTRVPDPYMVCQFHPPKFIKKSILLMLNNISLNLFFQRMKSFTSNRPKLTALVNGQRGIT